MGRKVWPRVPGGIRVRGRLFTSEEVALLRRLIARHPSWGRTKLSQRACELLHWKQPNGRLKDRGCRVALLRLEEQGLLKLPARLVENGGKPPLVHTDFHSPLECVRSFESMPVAVEARLVENRSDACLWNSLVDQHHYLGLRTPVGRVLRYLLVGDSKVFGAASFTESAWKLKCRDNALETIGLSPTDAHRSVICNNRFLILPGGHIRNLASKALAVCTTQAKEEWKRRFGSGPLLAETFVDPSRFRGTCYLAANWIAIGISKGFAKRGSSHRNHQNVKLYLIRGLEPEIQRRIGALRRSDLWNLIEQHWTTSHRISCKEAA